MVMKTESNKDLNNSTGGSSELPVTLTPMQYRFMLALQKRLSNNPHVGPTFEELRQDLGLSSKSGVARLVDSCIERGRITRLPNRDRSLVVIAPVDEQDFPREKLIKSFTDKELIIECHERGILSFNIKG